MNRPLLLIAAVAAHALPGCASAPRGPALPPSVTSDGDTIRPFTSQAELAQFLGELAAEGRREYDRVHANDPSPGPIIDHFYYIPTPPPRPVGVPVQVGTPSPDASGTVEVAPAPSSPPPSPAPAGSAPVRTVPPPSLPPPAPAPAPTSAPATSAPLQVQVHTSALGGTAAPAPAAGVDEGGIVKAAGEYLVVLHRGRLFSVRVGGGALDPVSALDAFGPGVDTENFMYDRLLVSGDRVLVLGTRTSWGNGNDIQVGVFHLAPDGRLTHRNTFFLRSLDAYGRYFYGPRTDAVRLVGDKLVFYVPLSAEVRDPLGAFPLVRGPGVVSTPAADVRVYRPAGRVVARGMHLHALTTCDLAEAAPRCTSTALLAGGDRPFHVTRTAVYLWARQKPWDEKAPARSTLYRIPLDGSTPTALHVTGNPVDQDAFLERDGYLHVLLDVDATDVPALRAEQPSRRVVLLRVPVSALGSGRNTADASHYRTLPLLPYGGVRYRFVGDWLVYSITDSPVGGQSSVYAQRLAGGGESRVVVPYRIERLEAMGSDAALIGKTERGRYLDVLRLGPEAATLAARRELDSLRLRPGFYFQPEGEGTGVLGLPLYGPDRPGHEFLQLGSASILFLRSQEQRLSEVGELASGEPIGDDVCVASCGLWYGNARPLFLRGRVLALLGYELVEGREEGGRIRELRRVRLGPLAPTAAAVAGAWEFTETIGHPQSPYLCANRGTMWLEPVVGGLRMRFRQTGECRIDGTTTRSDGEGSGIGTFGPAGLMLDVNGCRHVAALLNPDELRTTISCRLYAPSGMLMVLLGRLEARRARHTPAAGR